MARQQIPLSLLPSLLRPRPLAKPLHRPDLEESMPLLLGCAGVLVDLRAAELGEFRAGMRFAGATIIVSALAIFLLASYFEGV